MTLDADVGHQLRAGRRHEVAQVVAEGGQDGLVVGAGLGSQMCRLECVLRCRERKRRRIGVWGDERSTPCCMTGSVRRRTCSCETGSPM